MPSAPSSASLESYHTQHSPFGAFASFTLGLVDSPGGFGHALRGPARQNLYIGFRASTKSDWNLLPYFTPPKSNETAFVGELAVPQAPKNYQSLRPGDYTRELGWASDTWTADKSPLCVFTHHPFLPRVPDPAKLRGPDARFLLARLVCGSSSTTIVRELGRSSSASANPIAVFTRFPTTRARSRVSPAAPSSPTPPSLAKASSSVRASTSSLRNSATTAASSSSAVKPRSCSLSLPDRKSAFRSHSRFSMPAR
ncbi:MAG: glycoside hydrolase family 52 protein [Nibricoccus sp.]